MRCLATADLHGYLPDIPDCDILFIAGDILNDGHQFQHLKYKVKYWLEELCKRNIHVVATPGNHDFFLQNRPEEVDKLRLNWILLRHEFYEYKGLRIFGSPYSNQFGEWAYMLPESDLDLKWKEIPRNLDVLMVHGPAWGILDLSPYGNTHTGSHSLLKHIADFGPKVFLHGHIHSGYGQSKINRTTVYNCSYVDEQYWPANAVVEFTL